MTHDSTIDSYIDLHIDAEPENLYRLERATNIRLLNGRMCSGHLQGRILKMLTQMISPRDVLELGTFSGYSAICISEGLGEDAKFVTVEVDDELEDFIRQAFAEAPTGHKIELRIGDGMEILESYPCESLDMIFLDADKKRYPEYYRTCMARLRPGGYLLADNTLWDGHVCEPLRPHDAQTAAIKQFNDMAAADTEVERVILPLRDGLSIIRKLNHSQPRCK